MGEPSVDLVSCVTSLSNYRDYSKTVFESISKNSKEYNDGLLNESAKLMKDKQTAPQAKFLTLFLIVKLSESKNTLFLDRLNKSKEFIQYTYSVAGVDQNNGTNQKGKAILGKSNPILGNNYVNLALEAIEYWYVNFAEEGKNSARKTFFSMYDQLKKAGVNFPEQGILVGKQVKITDDFDQVGHYKGVNTSQGGAGVTQSQPVGTQKPPAQQQMSQSVDQGGLVQVFLKCVSSCVNYEKIYPQVEEAVFGSDQNQEMFFKFLEEQLSKPPKDQNTKPTEMFFTTYLLVKLTEKQNNPFIDRLCSKQHQAIFTKLFDLAQKDNKLEIEQRGKKVFGKTPELNILGNNFICLLLEAIKFWDGIKLADPNKPKKRQIFGTMFKMLTDHSITVPDELLYIGRDYDMKAFSPPGFEFFPRVDLKNKQSISKQSGQQQQGASQQQKAGADISNKPEVKKAKAAFDQVDEARTNLRELVQNTEKEDQEMMSLIFMLFDEYKKAVDQLIGNVEPLTAYQAQEIQNMIDQIYDEGSDKDKIEQSLKKYQSKKQKYDAFRNEVLNVLRRQRTPTPESQFQGTPGGPQTGGGGVQKEERKQEDPVPKSSGGIQMAQSTQVTKPDVEKQRQIEEQQRQIALKKQQEEEKRQADLKKQQEEEKRQADLKKQQEEQRQADLKKQQEEKRQADLRKQYEEQQRLKQQKQDEEKRQADLKRQQQEEEEELRRKQQQQQAIAQQRMQQGQSNASSISPNKKPQPSPGSQTTGNFAHGIIGEEHPQAGGRLYPHTQRELETDPSHLSINTSPDKFEKIEHDLHNIESNIMKSLKISRSKNKKETKQPKFKPIEELLHMKEMVRKFEKDKANLIAQNKKLRIALEHYDPREAEKIAEEHPEMPDPQIGILERENDRLKDELRTLRDENRELRMGVEERANDFFKQKIATVEQQNELLKNENEELINKNKYLSKRLAAREESVPGSEARSRGSPVKGGGDEHLVVVSNQPNKDATVITPGRHVYSTHMIQGGSKAKDRKNSKLVSPIRHGRFEKSRDFVPRSTEHSELDERYSRGMKPRVDTASPESRANTVRDVPTRQPELFPRTEKARHPSIGNHENSNIHEKSTRSQQDFLQPSNQEVIITTEKRQHQFVSSPDSRSERSHLMTTAERGRKPRGDDKLVFKDFMKRLDPEFVISPSPERSRMADLSRSPGGNHFDRKSGMMFGSNNTSKFHHQSPPPRSYSPFDSSLHSRGTSNDQGGLKFTRAFSPDYSQQQQFMSSGGFVSRSPTSEGRRNIENYMSNQSSRQYNQYK